MLSRLPAVTLIELLSPEYSLFYGAILILPYYLYCKVASCRRKVFVQTLVNGSRFLGAANKSNGCNDFLPNFLSIIPVYHFALCPYSMCSFFAHLIYLISWLCSRTFTQIPFTCHKWNACLFDLRKWLPQTKKKWADKHTCPLGTPVYLHAPLSI